MPGSFSRSIACALCCIAPLAQASKLVLEEVLVEARKVAEDSQTVPISMSVVTPQKVESLNAFDFTELDRIVPSLQLGQNSPASATLKIRNVGPDFFALAFPAAVAVYVDGVPQAQAGSVFSTMLDIERVEVLSGPQGTLYGKNAPAGLISIYTAKPDTGERSGYLTTSYSSWETWNNQLAVNVPLVQDTLALRVAGMYAESEGYLNNAIPTVDEGNGKEHRAVRAKLLWQPDTDVDVLLSYYAADIFTEDNGEGFEGQVPDDRGETLFSSGYDEYEVFKGIPSFSDTKVQEINLNIAWALEGVNLSLLAQYQDLDIFQQQDNSNFRTVPPPTVLRDYLEFNPVAWSTEIRADGVLGERLEYVSGVIYSEDDTDTVNFINNINIVGGATTEAFGVYTNWTYRIADRWETSLGARWSRVSYNATVFGFIPSIGELNSPYKEVYRDPSYSFKLNFYPAEDVLAYFAYDTAFRSGGLNVLAPLAATLAEQPFFASVADNLLTINRNYLEFTQEDSESFEIGLKGTFLDQRLRWNTAFFLQLYDDHQYRTSPSDGAVTPILSGALSNLAVNVEELEVYGVETEFNYLISEQWSAFFTAAYAKPEIQLYSKRMCEEGEADDPGTLVCPGRKGEPLNDEPELHLLAQLFYERPLGAGDLAVFGNLTAEYLDKPFQRVRTPNLRSVTTFDVTLGLRASDASWDLRLWCKNITDELVLPSEAVQLQAPAGGGEEALIGYSASPRAPRSVGVTGSYRF